MEDTRTAESYKITYEPATQAQWKQLHQWLGAETAWDLFPEK